MLEDEQRKIFARNLNKYLALSGKTQREVAKAIGVIPSTFNTWMQGIALPRMGKVQALADYFHINKSDLIEDHPAAPAELPHTRVGVVINVLGRVAAGIPIDAIEEIIDTEEIPQDMAKKGEYFGLKIKGDSMEPLIMDGDTVICRYCEDAADGDIIIAIINGDDGVCKKLKKTNYGINLISLNSKYDPLIFDRAEIDTIPVKIIGQVEEIRRKVR